MVKFEINWRLKATGWDNRYRGDGPEGDVPGLDSKGQPLLWLRLAGAVGLIAIVVAIGHVPERRKPLIPSGDGKAEISEAAIAEGVTVVNRAKNKELTNSPSKFSQFSHGKPVFDDDSDEFILLRTDGIGNQDLVGGRDTKIVGLSLLGSEEFHPRNDMHAIGWRLTSVENDWIELKSKRPCLSNGSTFNNREIGAQLSFIGLAGMEQSRSGNQP